MQYVTCNYCGRDDTQFINEGFDLLLNRPGQYRLVQCKNCDLIYQNPQLTRDELGEHYPADYLAYSNEETRTTYVEQISANHNHERKYQRIKKHHPRPGHILDVGCAAGEFLYVMSQHNWQTTGVELSESAAQYARDKLGLTVKLGTLIEARLPDNQFDVIVFWHVLEHVLDPKATLKEAARVLKPNGLLVLGLPNPDSIEAKLFKGAWRGWDQPRHLHLFTPSVIKRYVQELGFTITSLESFGGRLSGLLLSLEFKLKADGNYTEKHQRYLKWLYNLPLRLTLLPFFKLGEHFNKTTDMALFARYTNGKPT